MADLVQKMYGAFTGGALNDVATVDIQENGFIEGVLMILGATGADALDDEATIYLHADQSASVPYVGWRTRNHCHLRPG